ncbi:MAG: threonine synthase, partial [Peptostreptococcaceae bacterium]
YVPSKFPDFTDRLIELSNYNYIQLAYHILQPFLDDFTETELKSCINTAYGNKFDCPEIAPMTKIDKDFFLELYHGPTLAFKDIALTLMPHLLKTSISKNKLDKNILILTATSGDTGKAALEGFKNIDNIKIMVFFPEDGVSQIQKLQMQTQDGNNLFVAGIDGNFDDAQSGVKNIFSNTKIKSYLYDHNYILSSANSINIGRLLPQIIYYFYSYFNLYNKKEIKLFDKVNFVVPSGNFGNILAGYYAKEMGLPINKLICASNENNVLFDFFKTGEYSIQNRTLKTTTSPSMDILISSNLERLLFEVSNRNSNVVKNLYNELSSHKYYKVSNLIIDNLKSFCSYYSTEAEVKDTIKDTFDTYNYLIDTHTAVAYNALKKYKEETKDKSKSIILSTASPYKFANNILSSIDLSCSTETKKPFNTIHDLSRISHTPIPNSIMDLKGKNPIFQNIYNKSDLELAIYNFLEIR